MKKLPYIGITGFRTYKEVAEMLQVFMRHRRLHSERLLHVGVMTHYHRVNETSGESASSFIANDRIASVFCSPEVQVYNCLHYADMAHRKTLAADLRKAVALGGYNLDAIQLDLRWPRPERIAEALRDDTRRIEVILQIDKYILNEAGQSPANLVEKLKPYQGVIHRVLLDESMGQGEPMNPDRLLPYLRALSQSLPDLGLGVAGGLGPHGLEILKPILAEFPDISIDAEGKLSTRGHQGDPLDLAHTEKYLIHALRLVK
ncbi:MAG: hypothetical protein AAB381_02110 [Patescibacteria group bacterium]